MAQPDSETCEDFLGEEVVDVKGNPIGTLACFWEYDEGRPVLFGIDMGAHSNDIHLLPVNGARLDAKKSYFAVEFTREKVRLAPVLDCGAELDEKLETKVLDYYGSAAFSDDESEIFSVRALRRKNHTPSSK